MSHLNELYSTERMALGIQDIIERVHSIASFDRSMQPEFVQCDAAAMTLTVRYRVLPWMLGANQALHSGIMTAMADDTMGVLADYSTGGPGTPTITMEVNHLHPAPAGASLLFQSQLCALEEHMIHMSIVCHAESAPSTRLLTGTGIYYRPTQK